MNNFDYDIYSEINTSDKKDENYFFSEILNLYPDLRIFTTNNNNENHIPNFFLEQKGKNNINFIDPKKIEIKNDISSIAKENYDNNMELFENFITEEKNEIYFDENNKENENSFLGKKIKRKNKVIIEEKIKKVFNIEKEEFIYRLDYYKMAFISNFLTYVKGILNKLNENCNFCRKFGKSNFHTPKRELYGGNPKEEDNRKFIDKTIEEVFTDYEIKNKNKLEKGISRQKDNANLINRIKEYQETLSKKIQKDEKYLDQYQKINELINYLKLKIKDAMDDYYDSNEFEKFKSRTKIKYYDEMFYYERNRKFSLLEKNNFVRLVNLPYYSEKNKDKK